MKLAKFKKEVSFFVQIDQDFFINLVSFEFSKFKNL